MVQDQISFRCNDEGVVVESGLRRHVVEGLQHRRPKSFVFIIIIEDPVVVPSEGLEMFRARQWQIQGLEVLFLVELGRRSSEGL